MALNKNHKGFSLIELMIALVVMSFLMLGIFNFFTRTTRTAMNGAAMNNLSRQMSTLTVQLRKSMKTMGYNPTLQFYPVAFNSTQNPILGEDPTPALHRIGITYANTSEIQFTSDFSSLPTSSTGLPDGKIDPTESFRFWVTGDNPSATAISFYGRTRRDADPCIPNTGEHFTTPYKLYGLSQSNPVVIANNVLCFEVRYFRKGDTNPDRQEDSWVQMCPYDSIGTAGYQPTTCPAKTPLKKGEALSSPGETASSGYDEEKYYTDLRDKVQKIEMGVLVQKLTGQECERAKVSDPSDEACQERAIIELKLPNRPWLYSAATGRTN